MAITTDPESPLAAEEVTLSSSAAGGNTTRWKLTSLPSESALSTGFLVDAAGEYVETFTPDVAGEYGFTAYGYTNFQTVATHAADVVVSRSAFVGSESDTVHVAGYASIPIRTRNGNGCTLRFKVKNFTIVDAECIDAINDASRVAILTAGVTAALAAVIGADADETIDLINGSNALRTAYEAHRIRTAGATHAAADTTNVVEPMDAATLDDAIKLVNALADMLGAHLVAGASGTRWHRTVDDTTNTSAVDKATTVAGAYVLLQDLSYRVYERHRVFLDGFDVHGASDSTNTLAASQLIDDVIVAIIDALADATPSAPTGEPEGLTYLAQAHGFSVS